MEISNSIRSRVSIITGIMLVIVLSAFSMRMGNDDTMLSQVTRILRPSVLKDAAWALTQSPITVTAESCVRSSGGKHDFYSEGDYWWPNPKSVDSPYVQRDGMTNPHNFVAHRKAMIRFSRIIGALTSAYLLTHDQRYTKHALMHLKAWFADPLTLMNPNLQYAQAIQGIATGRGIGIIDTIQLMEVVQGMLVMEREGAISQQDLNIFRQWFDMYTDWLSNHPYGKAEMSARNNHGTCWVMQTACFARFTHNSALLEFCRKRYKEVLLPDQMAADGSFPLELKRTKPYGYSIFNLDAMTTICQILSTPDDSLWQFSAANGRSIKKGIESLYPYLKEKQKWPYPHDVMYWNDWPVAQPALVFGALALNQPLWLKTWTDQEHRPHEDEVIRNLPVRYPLIWTQ